jgi:hypothetical protein
MVSVLLPSTPRFVIKDAIVNKRTIHAHYQGHSVEFRPFAMGTKNVQERVFGLEVPSGKWRCFVITGLTDVKTGRKFHYCGTDPWPPCCKGCLDHIDVEIKP